MSNSNEIKIDGKTLNVLWGVGAAQALYIHDGHWYHPLKQFPGAFFDKNGFIKFDTEDEYRNCTYLQIRKQVSVPKHISSIPGYVRVTHIQEIITDLSLEEKPFDPTNVDDARRRTARAIIARQGQIQFRSKLLKAYGGRCCITDCNALPALEAAHIRPYQGPGTNHTTNGLLLRADIHTLFDQGLLGIDDVNLSVIVSPALYGTSYTDFKGASIRVPNKSADGPSRLALAWHLHEHDLKT